MRVRHRVRHTQLHDTHPLSGCTLLRIFHNLDPSRKALGPGAQELLPLKAPPDVQEADHRMHIGIERYRCEEDLWLASGVALAVHGSELPNEPIAKGTCCRGVHDLQAD